jgi:hypothetical protein
VTFVDIQPELDASSLSSGGGWANALTWLEINALQSRLAAYLGKGLFDSGLSDKVCDLLIVQVDTDVLDEDDFKNFVAKRKGLVVTSPISPSDRFDEVRRVLCEFCGFNDLMEATEASHVLAPAVENTETWCVSVRDPIVKGIEFLRKRAILVEYRTRLVAFESGVKNAKPKNVASRSAYCNHHSADFARLEDHCSQYTRLVLDVQQILDV